MQKGQVLLAVLDFVPVILLGLWLYALLVTGIEGVTRLTEQTFGH